MLVLKRSVGECIQIGDDIFMTILQSRRNQILLSFKAPLSVVIDGQEVVYQKKQFKKEQHNECLKKTESFNTKGKLGAAYRASFQKRSSQ